MWSLFSEPLEKQYYAGWFSRSWWLSVGCCLFAFALPILVLLSIGYSWNSHRYSLVQPTLSFENYQATCLLSNGSTTYDSTFVGQLTPNSYQLFLSVGAEANELLVSAVVQPANVSACSLLLYFQLTLSNRLPTVAVLPLQFYRGTGNNGLWMGGVKEWGRVEVSLLSAIPESSIASGQGLLYHGNNSQTLSIPDVHQAYATSKNVSLSPVIAASQISYSTASAGVAYQGRFSVSGCSLLEEVGLLENLRTFVPHFIYLFVLLWVFLAQPTVRWMLENQIYRAKVSHHKVKLH